MRIKGILVIVLMLYCFANIDTQTLVEVSFLGYFWLFFHPNNDVTQRLGQIFMCRGMF